MFKHFLCFVVIPGALVACAPPPADTAADTSAELAALKAEVQEWMSAFNAGDAAGVAALYTEDGVIMPPDAETVTGRAAIRDFIAADSAAMQEQGLTFSGENSSDGAIDGDMAWVSGAGSVKDASGATVGSAKYLTIYSRVNGDWQIKRDTWNFDPAPDQGGEIVQAYIDAWNALDLDSLDAVVADDFKRRAPDQNLDSRDELKAFITKIHDTYANFSVTLEEYSASGDLIFVAWNTTSSGLKGSESEQAVAVPGMTMLQIVDGRIAEEHVFYDTATLNAQLGTAETPHVE